MLNLAHSLPVTAGRFFFARTERSHFFLRLHNRFGDCYLRGPSTSILLMFVTTLFKFIRAQRLRPANAFRWLGIGPPEVFEEVRIRMSNWCENVLGVAGPYNEVQKFIKNARGEPPLDERAKPQPVCFQTLFPADTSDEGVPDDTYLPGMTSPAWSKDRCAKWGVKWDANFWDQDLTWTIMDQRNSEWNNKKHGPQDQCCAIINFDTAWNPPLKLVDKVAQDYSALAFRLQYKEEGAGIKGVAKWRDGKRVRTKGRSDRDACG